MEIKQFIEKASKNSEISFVEAINLDRILKENNHELIPISFSKNGIFPKLDKESMNNFLKTSFKKKKNSLVKISKDFHPKDNMIDGFEQLENYEINAINIFYANYLLSQNDINAWKYFFNKYLLTYGGWKIDLQSIKFNNIFEVFKESISSSKNIYYDGSLVTVIMPVFNNENTIPYAVKSILNQTHQNIELIIVDDCSADTTELVCKNLMNEDKRIKYLKNKQNSGAYISRNNGLKIAKGEYITILDGDDWSFPQRIGYQLNQLKNNVNSKAHLGYCIRIHSNGLIDNFKVCTDWCFDGLLSKCLASIMIEKKFFDEVLGYWDSVRFGADSELYYRILAIDEKLIVEDIVPLCLALDRENSLTNTEASKIGGELRSQYAKNFLDFHQKAKVEELYYKYPQNKRPFAIPKEMELNSTIQKDFSVNSKKIFLLGTCRLHRLFIKNIKGQIIDNTDKRVIVQYPKIGFFHTLPEILQTIKWIHGDLKIPSNLAKYIFRKENPSTTPSNEFDESLEKAIKKNLLIEAPKIDLEKIDYFIFEICSLKAYFDKESKLYFHANPNFVGNIPYNQIPKDGIYGKTALNVPSVLNQFQSKELMERHFEELFKIIDSRKIIIFGHLLDPNNPNQTRKEVNDTLKIMSDKFKFKYVDTSLFVQKFGFNMSNEGGVDIHHLSNDGEIELGKYVQKIILEEEIVI